MNLQQLEEAKKIVQEIAELANHKEAINRRAEVGGLFIELDCKSNSWSRMRLDSKFFVISLDEFIPLYITKVDKRIKELEEEFNKL